ncbi:temperature dependent protein affecting M2 dsRNA replication [Mycotypha africana]|uniref:temperature dependent protein affecting M2 dsRNA replication n=1 Tax=Mycotypha africana TaxID=64632 RepID=UPI00230108BB|nr:temperature dependent protein affecting M2 dsRNA replication [Mycotypha africana]KAI8979044.1 temperature dependent protein affecting M2 dsRNA replication [Mycotypha africana]
MLEIRDFVTSLKHVPTPWGKALASGLNRDTDTPTGTHVQEALLTALELIRFEVLTNREFSKTYSRPLGDETQKKHIILLSRAFSLLPMQLKSQPWSGALNRDLLAFNSFVKALARSYRNLCEMLTLSFFLNGLVMKDRKDYFQISESLPFMSDHNVALGLVCKYYLEQFVEGKSLSEALKATENAFPTCQNVKDDLKQGFKFWQLLIKAVNILVIEESIDIAIGDMFKNADKWLEQNSINKL